MKFSKLMSAAAALIIGVSGIPVGTAAAADEQLVDSGLDYTESTDTINNPGMGYTSTLWYTCKPGNTPVKNPTGSIVLMFINIGAFSSGANGTTDEDKNYTEGTDYDLDDAFFAGLRGTFENARKNGCTIAVRFRYDENGKTNPEPASFDQVLRHIDQIKENGILEDYKDILMFVESGFVGAWGEQHSGKYTSLEYKAQLLDAMLDLVPDDISVTVRTPNTFAKWAGIPTSEIDQWVSEPGSDAARVGMYNDGYMGSDSDLGTYSNRQKETDWLGRQTVAAYYGGEFSGNLSWAQKYDTYLPENAIPEMYKTHLSYINSNIYALYKDYTFSEQYDTVDADNSAYYGQTVHKFMRDHLGYRFVLRDSDLSGEVEQGGTLKLDISVENTGFANPIRPQKAEVILEKDGNYVKTEVDIDTREWRSCTTSDEELELKIPGGLEPGDWNVYLRFSVGNDGVKDGHMRSVHFANNGIWNPSLGANLMGSFKVTKSNSIPNLTNTKLVQTNAENAVAASEGDMYTINNMTILDGVRSGEAEWTDSLLLGTNGDRKLYVTNDDKYLYVMAEIEQSATSPVYNLQIRNGSEDDKFYWMYYASNGYVYFNNGSYDGCDCKRIGKYSEFRIPFGSVMNIYPGTVLSSVRVSIQDSSNEWVNVGEVTGKNYTVTDTFYVYTEKRTVSLNQNDDLPMLVEASLDSAKYQWYHDGEVISGANEKTFTLKNASADSEGLYTVEITSETGTVREVEVCQIEKVYSSSLKGDLNGDGEVTVADAVILQRYLLGAMRPDEFIFANSDIIEDGSTDAFDMIEMRRLIIE